MKLSNEALAAIVEIFRRGILELTDVSQELRDLDLVIDEHERLIPKQETKTKAEGV